MTYTKLVDQRGRSTFERSPAFSWLRPRSGTGAASLIREHRDLYVQALAELQAMDENDTLSYFQIMGECSPPSRLVAGQSGH